MLNNFNAEQDLNSRIENTDNITNENSFYTNAIYFSTLGNSVGNSQEQIMAEEGQLETKRIILWNATGLQNSLDRLIAVMNETDAMLAFVVETWFDPERSIPKCCAFSAFGPMSGLRYRRGNGVSVVVNSRYKDSLMVQDMVCLGKDTVNGCFVIVDFAGIKWLACYNPPSGSVDLEALLTSAMAVGRISPQDKLVVLGDFNARLPAWGDTLSNAEGRKLYGWLETVQLQRLSTGSAPTFSSASGNSIIDHVFCNLPEASAQLARKPDPLSPHSPILVNFRPRPYSRPSDRSYMRLKLERLRDETVCADFKDTTRYKNRRLLDKLNEIMSEGENNITRDIGILERHIEASDKLICAFFIDIAKSELGEKRAGKRNYCYKPLQSLTLDDLYAQQELEPTAARGRHIIKELSLLRRENYLKFTESLAGRPLKDVVKTVAQINASRKSQSCALQSSPAALDEYAQYFANLTRNELPVPRDLRNVELGLNVNESLTLAEDIFTVGRLMKILADVPWGKASGASGVSYDLIKAADFSVLETLTLWFRWLFTKGRVPQSWTRSLIVPVPKKGDLNSIKNYRPISLTESFRKLFEHCVLRWLQSHCQPVHFAQGGFRSHHCVNDMVLSLHQVLSTHKDMHVAFLDIKAAYDSVDRRILWRRCKEMNFPDPVIHILMRLFDHNSAQLVLEGKRSRPFGISSGVLQGSVLSPFLYSVFINDLAEELSKHSTVKVGDCNLNCTLYADDIALFARSAMELQMLLFFCSRHANMNRYQFSVEKCAVIGSSNFDYKISSKLIPRCESFCYLGVEVGRSGILPSKFIKRRCEITTTAGMKLAMMGMNIGGFPQHILINLYKTFIRSKLEASTCLLVPLKKSLRKIEAAQRTVLARIFFCSGHCTSGPILMGICGVPSMSFRQKFLRSRYVARVNALPQSHILQMMRSDRKFFLNRLSKDVFIAEDLQRAVKVRELKSAEYEKCCAEASNVTGGFLKLVPDGRPAYFIRAPMDVSRKKNICHWILKKYPASAPPTCRHCRTASASQVHVASCNQLLENLAPDIPARFRPEFLLSQDNPPLELIATSIDRAVRNCLPFFA